MAIKLKIEQGDIKKTVTLRQLLKAQSGDMSAIIEIMANFVYDDGKLLPYEQGKEIVLDLTIEELEQATKALYSGVQDAVVPPSNAAS